MLDRSWREPILRLAAVIAAALVLPGCLSAQPRSVPQIASVVRDDPARSEAHDVLSMRIPGYSRAQREELADSLLAIALGAPGLPSRTAITALAFAGRPDRASPFPGALDRLLQIFSETDDEEIKLNAFGGFLDVAGSEASFTLVQRFASEPGAVGALAFDALASRADPASVYFRPSMVAVLRRIVAEGGLTSPLAQAQAKAIATARGWPYGGGD